MAQVQMVLPVSRSNGASAHRPPQPPSGPRATEPVAAPGAVTAAPPPETSVDQPSPPVAVPDSVRRITTAAVLAVATVAAVTRHTRRLA